MCVGGPPTHEVSSLQGDTVSGTKQSLAGVGLSIALLRMLAAPRGEARRLLESEPPGAPDGRSTGPDARRRAGRRRGSRRVRACP